MGKLPIVREPLLYNIHSYSVMSTDLVTLRAADLSSRDASPRRWYCCTLQPNVSCWETVRRNERVQSWFSLIFLPKSFIHSSNIFMKKKINFTWPNQNGVYVKQVNKTDRHDVECLVVDRGVVFGGWNEGRSLVFVPRTPGPTNSTARRWSPALSRR